MFVLALLPLFLGPIETVDSKEFSKELQTTAVTATVRIVNTARNTDGSGVIIKRSEPFVYILTASHLVDKSDRLEVHTFSAKSYPEADNVYRAVRVLAQDKNSDLAVLRVPTAAPELGVVQVCPPRLLRDDKEFAALAVGCSCAAAPSCVVETISGKKRVRKHPGAAPMLVWEATRAQETGRSGGPLIEKQGYLIGLASGTSDRKGYYSHAEEIHKFLAQNGLKWLGEENK